METLTLPVDFSALHALRDLVTRSGRIAALTEKEVHDLMLAVDEAATNVIRHAGPHHPGAVLNCAAMPDDKLRALTIELQYNARELFSPNPPTARQIEERLRSYTRGGLGLYLIHHLVDSIDYHHHHGQNTIRLVKRHKV